MKDAGRVRWLKEGAIICAVPQAGLILEMQGCEGPVWLQEGQCVCVCEWGQCQQSIAVANSFNMRALAGYIKDSGFYSKSMENHQGF